MITMQGTRGTSFRLALALLCLAPALAGAADDLGSGEPGWDLPALPSVSLADVPRNEAHVSQQGTANTLELYQNGSAQLSVIQQWGSDNHAGVEQQGYEQLVQIQQVGTGNEALVIQHGQSQSVRVQQWGDYQRARIVQAD